MTNLLQEFRFAWRMLVKSPVFTAVAVVSLALGIGANTAIFSVVNAFLLRPPSFEEPSRLVRLTSTDEEGNLHSFSYADYRDLRQMNDALSGLAAHSGYRAGISWAQSSEVVFGELVSDNYFAVLGVEADTGRTFRESEGRVPGADPVVILSHDFWRRSLSADPEVVNRTLHFNGHPLTVIGVAPEDFRGTLEGGIFPSAFWAPITMHAELGADYDLEDRTRVEFELVGRLQEGLSVKEAQASLSNAARQLAVTYPETNQDRGIQVAGLESVLPSAKGPLTGFMSFLMVIVGLVLLIACTNLANLILARNAARQKEIATRLALGASSRRLKSQLLVESLLLALLGGALGLIVSYWLMRLLATVRIPNPAQMPVELDLTLDFRVLIFCLFVSLFTVLLFGLTPAVHASRRHQLTDALRDSAQSTSGGRNRLRMRKLFIVVQVALSMLLLIVAGLFLRSLRRASTLDPGFEMDNQLIMSIDLGLRGYTEAEGTTFYSRLLDRTEGLPGVESASLGRRAPLSWGTSMNSFVISGQERFTDIDFNVVGPHYAETLGIPILRGRMLDARDIADSPQTIVINQAAAERFWPEGDAIGKRVSFAGAQGPWAEVVGVLATTKVRNLGEQPRPFLYQSLTHSYQPTMILHVRTATDPRSVIPAVREVVRELDPNLPLYNIQTLREHLAGTLLPQRLAASLLGSFGLLVLLLAGIGIFGVIAYSVNQRTREMGIRMAVGAQRSTLMRLVIRQGLFLVGLGVALGLGLALLVTRFLSSLLNGIQPTDPIVFAGITLVMVGVALFAILVPARRVSAMDPLIALRQE